MARVEQKHISALLSKWTSVNANTKPTKGKGKGKVLVTSYQDPTTLLDAGDSDGEATWKRFRAECVLLRGGVK